MIKKLENALPHRPRTRIGVIGLGFGQHVHLPLLLADSNCEVVGLCARSKEKAERVVGAAPNARAYGEYLTMMDEAQPDAVTIAVPPVAQPDIICAAAERGIHVFCEKPLASDDSGANRAMGAIKEAKLITGVDFIFPELTTWKELKRLLSEDFGVVRHVALSWRVETYAYARRTESWKKDPRAGGGALNSFGSHTFYYLEWLFGPIARLRGTLGPDDGSEARMDVSLVFVSGATAIVSIASDAFSGTGHRLEVYGDDAVAILSNPGADYTKDFSLNVRFRRDQAMRTTALERSTDIDGRLTATRPLLNRFVTAVRDRSRMDPNASDAFRVQRLMSLTRSSHSSLEWLVP